MALFVFLSFADVEIFIGLRRGVVQLTPGRGGGGLLLVKYYWGCAAGWGHIFPTGLTIMGLHF